MRGPLLVAAVAAMALPLLAGCLGDAAGQDGDSSAPASDPYPAVAYQGTCSVALLFEFVDYAQTDQYLPPGFHPRDPQEFLTVIPVALGQAGIIVLVLACDGPTGTADYASVGIFVEPPTVEGVEPGLFDFYEVARYGSNDPFRPALAAADWPAHDADVEVQLSIDAAGTPAQLRAAITDGDGPLASFEGLTPAAVDVGAGLVRYWHESPGGLGLLEIDVDLNAQVGGGICAVRGGTELAGFIGGSQCLPPAEPIIGAFPDLAYAATARFLPGVHAE